jgi:UDP-glucose 4-epimerase
MLVTGGAGFIGSHLVKSLVHRGDTVTVVDNFSTGRAQNLEGIDVHLVEGDIRDRSLMEETLQDQDVLFHQAAMVSVPESMADPVLCYDVNVNGTLNLLWTAHLAGIRRVVLASSCAVYGDAEQSLAEDQQLYPLSPYASSKLALEGIASMFNRAYDLPTISLRYFNVFGPFQRPDSPYAAAIPIFIDAMLSGVAPTIFGDGEQTRDFVFVKDIVKANILAAEQDRAISGVFNVGGPGSISINQLVELLRKFIPDAPGTVYDPPRPGDILYSSAEGSHAEAALGYRPEIALEQGLQQTVQWFESRRQTASA